MSFLQRETVSGCIISLNEKRWNWRHDSILINIARFMAKLQGVKVYCDVNNSEFQTPSVITGNDKRPDIVVLKDKTCMILELTVRPLPFGLVTYTTFHPEHHAYL